MDNNRDNNTTTTTTTNNTENIPKKRKKYPKKVYKSKRDQAKIKKPRTALTKTSRPKTNADWTKNLTPFQKLFVIAIADGLSDTFGDPVESYKSSGYKWSKTEDRGKIKARAVGIYRSKRVQEAILAYNREMYKKLEVNREFTLQRLIDTYNRAVINKDGSVQAKMVDLMMKYNNMLSVNVNVNVAEIQQLEQRQEKEAEALGTLRVKQILAKELHSKPLLEQQQEPPADTPALIDEPEQSNENGHSAFEDIDPIEAVLTGNKPDFE